ncbi:MAG: efflux transporter outer membrane subunit [Opitutales bacterium]|nr:efflux transporter outer membrane subunit [Opitutales bacterium]
MNDIFAKTLLAFAAAAMCACAVGPDFEKPQYGGAPEFFKNFGGENISEKSEEEADIENWWEVFGDSVLNSLVSRALEHNFDLNMARASVEAAYARLGMSQSGLLPALDANGGFSERGTMKGASRGFTSAGLSAGWEIDVFGGVRRGVESAAADYEAARANKCAVKMEVAASVVSAYFLYRYHCEDFEITRQNVETQQNTLRVIKKRLENKLVSKLDFARSEAQLKSTMAKLPTIEADIGISLRALEILLGLDMGSLEGELKDLRGLPDFEKHAPAAVPAKVLRRRPDVIEAEYKLHAATAKIGEAEADFYPKFSITGMISYSAPASANLFNSQYGTWSVGPTVSWNLFSAGKTYYNVKLQQALTKQAGISWRQTVLNAVREVQDALVASEKQREKTQMLRQAAQSNKDAYELSFKLFKAGELEFLDLLDVQRTMLVAQQSLLDSRRQNLENAIALYKALGGGWSGADFKKDEETRKDWLSELWLTERR